MVEINRSGEKLADDFCCKMGKVFGEQAKALKVGDNNRILASRLVYLAGSVCGHVCCGKGATLIWRNSTDCQKPAGRWRYTDCYYYFAGESSVLIPLD